MEALFYLIVLLGIFMLASAAIIRGGIDNLARVLREDSIAIAQEEVEKARREGRMSA